MKDLGAFNPSLKSLAKGGGLFGTILLCDINEAKSLFLINRGARIARIHITLNKMCGTSWN